MATDTLLEAKVNEYERMKGDRQVYTSHWQDVSLYTLPTRDFYESKMPGQKRNARIFDTTAMIANEQLANTLHSRLTTPNSPWFQLVVAQTKFAADRAALMWLEESNRRMAMIFNSTAGQFNTQAHEMYLELCAFGNGIMYVDYRNGYIRFRARPLSDCFIRQNDYGTVDTLYRCTKTPVHAALKFFGSYATKRMHELYEKNPMEKIDILHCVEPRLDIQTAYTPHKSKKPWESTFIDLAGKEQIAQGGYDSFPYITPRFGMRSGEEYGYGPGVTAFPDSRMCNRIGELIIRSSEKLVDPPLMVPDDGVIGALSLNAAARITIRDGKEIKPLVTGAQPQLAQAVLANVQSRIMKMFYVDWLNSDPTDGKQPLTATEVMDNRDKNFQMLSPMLSRIETEGCGPLIDRVFNLAFVNGMLPPLPGSLEGINLKIEYLSPIARAQRANTMESINKVFGFVAQQMQLGDPGAAYNIKRDETIQYVAREINNIPEHLITPLDEVKKMRADDAKAQQNQQQTENASNAANIVHQTSGATLNLKQAQVAGNA